jgi:hypothetical protein
MYTDEEDRSLKRGWLEFDREDKHPDRGWLEFIVQMGEGEQ